MWQRFTERARSAVFYAQEEAGRHGISWVSPECLLLGVIRDADCMAVAMLKKLGVSLEELRRRTDASCPVEAPSSGGDMQLTPSAKRAIDLAYDEARSSRSKSIGTEHLLIGIARGESGAAGLLSAMGAAADALRQAVPHDDSGDAPRAGDGRAASQLARRLHEDALDLRGASLLSMADLSPEQVRGILEGAEELRQARTEGRTPVAWNGQKSLAMVFEKASLRTRVTFELGMRELGGIPIVLGPTEIGLGKRENVADIARNLDRWVSAVMARVYDHRTLTELHKHSSVPIINALSDIEHPCQTLADLQALMQRRGKLEGLRVAWVGDGNNVLHSLMLGAALVGASVVAACPPGYEPDPKIVKRARELADARAIIEVVTEPEEAVVGSDAVYTDVWVSMGHEAEAGARREVFARYQVNEALMKHAGDDALFMHCLPAHRGEEVTDEVLDGPASIVLDQAENRLHAQKALLALLIGP